MTFLQTIESYGLLILSCGLMLIRYYLSDFLNHDGKYATKDIIFLMFPSSYMAITLAMFYSFSYYHGYVTDLTLTETEVTYLLIIPKTIFYCTLFYFTYWLLKMIQKKQELYIHQEEDNKSDRF